MDDDFDHMGMRVGAGGGIMNENNEWNNDTPQGIWSLFTTKFSLIHLNKLFLLKVGINTFKKSD